MRLKQDLGPMTVSENRLNLRNVSLQGRNSNEPKFNSNLVLDNAPWDTYRNQNGTKKLSKDLASQDLSQNNLADPRDFLQYSPVTPSSLDYELSPDESDDTACSSSDTSPGSAAYEGEYRTFQDDLSDSDCVASSSAASSAASSPGEPAPAPGRGIVNPNYPGFQQLAARLLRLAAGSDDEDGEEVEDKPQTQEEEENNNNNNLVTNNKNNDININLGFVDKINYEETPSADYKIDAVNQLNQLDVSDVKKELYDKPKLAAPMADAFLSSAKEDLALGREFLPPAHVPRLPAQMKMSVKQAAPPTMVPMGAVAPLAPMAPMGAKQSVGVPQPCMQPTLQLFKQIKNKDSNRALEEMEEVVEKFNKEATEKDPEVVPRKKEKMAMNHHARKARHSMGPMGPTPDRSSANHRRGPPGAPGGPGAHKKRSSLEILGGFDVYNIETAMPKIDLDLIESHLRAAKEEERRRRNDREEIRRRLAMGSEDGDFYGNEKPGKKPSLQARLQSGMNLQICFMNETLSDTESPGSEGEVPVTGAAAIAKTAPILNLQPKIEPATERLPHIHHDSIPKPTRPVSLPLRLDAQREWREHASLMTEADFLARQAQLQAEARVALAQAKDMAHMQMEVERQRQNASPITEMVRHSLQKVGVAFPEDRRRLSRQILTEMNVAQLQVIVNDLHTQIEYLNESLVRLLMERDDLHMEQDSMLVDIEDLTRYLGAKEQSVKGGLSQNNNLLTSNGAATTAAATVIASVGRIGMRK